MNLNEYLDAARFPLTTQRGVSAEEQLLIDASRHDRLKEFLEDGGILTAEQQKRWDELQAKMQHHAELTAEVTLAETVREVAHG
jgi:hypothetical protein